MTCPSIPTGQPRGVRWPGLLTAGIGAAHLLLGARRYASDLRALPHPVPDAPLWFMTTGLSLVLLGADVAVSPGAVAAPARRLRGAGLGVIAFAILTQRRRSGAWALLPAGLAMAVAGRRKAVPVAAGEPGSRRVGM